jgi:hypothetical protein
MVSVQYSTASSDLSQVQESLSRSLHFGSGLGRDSKGRVNVGVELGVRRIIGHRKRNESHSPSQG